MSQKRLKYLVRDLNRMMAVTPLNTDDYRVLLEELRKAKIALRQSPTPAGNGPNPQSPRGR